MYKLVCILLISQVPLLLGAQNSSAAEVIRLFGENLSTVTDYQCRMYEWSKKGRKEEIRYINFYFHAPRIIRMDIVKGNRSGDTGSIGVLQSDGRVRGRKGGILSPIVLNVNKNSRLATTIRGVTFDGSDAIAAWTRLNYLLENSTIELREDPEGWLFECTLFTPENNITKEILYLSAADMMPLYTESYEEDNLVQYVKWRSYIINSGIPIEFFDVYTKAETLNDLKIPNNLALPLELEE